MSKEEVMVLAFSMFFVIVMYRVLMEGILKENVGEAKAHDINYLLHWETCVIGWYMKPYIKKYRFQYYIFRTICLTSFIMGIFLMFCLLLPFPQDSVFWDGIWLLSHGYLLIIGFALWITPWKLWEKDDITAKVPKPTYTFHEAVERFQAAQQVWDTIPPKGHRGFRKKILKELQSRAIDMQPPLVNEWLRIVGWSEEKREAGVKYAWDCLCEVEELSAKMGMPRNMRKESLIFMTYEDLEQRFEQAMSELQQAETEEEQNRCRKRAVVVAIHFARRMKEFHQNNAAGHRDDSSAIIEQYQIVQNMLERAGDCPYKEREQDLFDSIQDIYEFAAKKKACDG